MGIAIILGTRPEIIKMSPVIKELEKLNEEYFILHTGQHYDYELDKIFFEELKLRPEAINLNIGSGTHGEATGKMMIGIEKVLLKEKPQITLVQGDTNTALAGSLTSVKLGINLGHVEAGLRSYDRRQPEEFNRVVADHVGNYLFVPTKKSERTLRGEGIPEEYIFLTGNTIVDVVYSHINKLRERSEIFDDLEVEGKEYILVTAHREENVDYKSRLLGILEGLKNISREFELPIIFPIHPRTRKRIDEFGLNKLLEKIRNLKIIRPIGFFDTLALEKNAKLVLTDSGGIQEEACILKTPCVVLRDRSDRPESIEVGASMLAGCDGDKILEASKKMIDRKTTWENPFGDGRAGKRIIKIVRNSMK